MLALLEPVVAPPMPVRLFLREATAPIHRRLDDRAGRFDLTSRDDYDAFLAAHATVILPLETALEAAGVTNVIPDWPERRRTGALRADLAGRNVALHPVPAFRGVSEIFGALYVLEGSRLGAQVILRGIAPRFPTVYLRHGEGRKLWPRFIDLLESARIDPDRAAASAVSVFQSFERAFA